jgi:hypothetical protein
VCVVDLVSPAETLGERGGTQGNKQKYLFNEKEKREEEEREVTKEKRERGCIPLALVQHLGVRESRTTQTGDACQL